MKTTTILREIKNKYFKKNILGYLYDNLESEALFDFQKLVYSQKFIVNRNSSGDYYIPMGNDYGPEINGQFIIYYSTSYSYRLVLNKNLISEKPVTIYFTIVYGTIKIPINVLIGNDDDSDLYKLANIQSSTLYKLVTNPNYSNGNVGTITNVLTGEEIKLIIQE